MLLLNARTVVAVERLVEAVWDDALPATARGQIAICISQLRSTLRGLTGSDDIVVTRAPGYLLDVADLQIDARIFARQAARAFALSAEGGAAEAVDMMRAALRAWRGPALAGVDGYVLRSEAARLDESRLSVLRECVALELELGRHEDVIGELTALVAEHPLHEHFRGQLMTAQYRCGRRAEALETYQDGRSRLVDELGIEPGPALQSVQAAILADQLVLIDTPYSGNGREPAVPLTGRPFQLPPDASVFVGRKDELAMLDGVLEPGYGEPPLRVGLVTGVGGVGKTGLALHWAHRVADVFPDGQLFVDLRGYDATNEPLPANTVLERFLRSLGVPGARIPADPDERADLFRSLQDGRRMLVILDNARSADQVRPLLPGSGSCCVIVTSRDPLDDLVISLGASRLALRVPPENDAIALLAAVVGAERVATDPAAALRLAQLCDGLPLALRIAAARLASKHHWTLKKMVGRLADERRRLDELSHGGRDVRGSLWLGYRYLPPKAIKMYRRLGLLDVPDFTAWVGGALIDTGVAEAEDIVEQLVDMQLLEVVGEDATGQLRYRFHDLLRLYALERCEAEENPEERQAALARAFGAWMALAEEAHRREYGGDYTLIHGAAPRWRLDRALEDRLLSHPLTWLESERLAILSVIRQAAQSGLHELCWDLAMTVTTLFEAGSWFDDWQVACGWALAATRKASNARGEAAMLYGLGTLHVYQQRYPAAAELLNSALELFERTSELHGYALALRNTALLDRMRGDMAAAMCRYHDAEELLRKVGDRSAEAHVLFNMAQVELERGDLDSSERMLDEAMVICRDIGNIRNQAQVLYRLGDVYLARDEPDRASEAFEKVLGLVKVSGDAVGAAYALRGLGEAQLDRGQVDEAETSLLDGLRNARDTADRFAEARASLVLGKLWAARGEFVCADRHLKAACKTFEKIHAPLWQARSLHVLGISQKSGGQASEARQSWTRARELFTAKACHEVKHVVALLDDTAS